MWNILLLIIILIIGLPILFFGSFFIGALIFAIHSRIIKKEPYGGEKKDK
tara:strand:- start:2596 stop:2745 length:150 start_codon:yes stop_codon:yes gene_type:complete